MPPVTSEERIAHQEQQGGSSLAACVTPHLRLPVHWWKALPAFLRNRFDPGPLTRAITTKPWIILTSCKAPVSSLRGCAVMMAVLPSSAFILQSPEDRAGSFPAGYEDCRNRVYFKWGYKYINLCLMPCRKTCSGHPVLSTPGSHSPAHQPPDLCREHPIRAEVGEDHIRSKGHGKTANQRPGKDRKEGKKHAQAQ